MGRLRYALWPAGLALGVAAEWIGEPEFTILDATAGFALVFLGLAAWSRRPGSGVGPIMAAAGFAWFLGTIWNPAVFLHRGPLAHLLLSYPSGKLSGRFDRAAVATAYLYAAAYPVAANDYATIAFAVALLALTARRYALAGGPERRARLASLTAAASFAVVLALGAVARLADVNTGGTSLVAYDLVVGLIAVGLFADLLWGRWAQAAVTGLVVDLGETAAAGPLRERLARTVGDPTLVVGYWLPEQGRYVDEAGRPVELPPAGTDRTITPIEEDGTRIAALVTMWPFSTIPVSSLRSPRRRGSQSPTHGSRPRCAPGSRRWTSHGGASSTRPMPSAGGWNGSCAKVLSGGLLMSRSCSPTPTPWRMSAATSSRLASSCGNSPVAFIRRPLPSTG
jgi:hypothetical protein